MDETAARQRLLELLKQHGWNSTAFQLLESDFSYWFGEGACVGYVSTRFARVAAGAPVADVGSIGDAALRFIDDSRSAGRRVAFFGVERRLLETTALASVVVGEQPWWNPQEWSRRRRAHRSIGEQIRRARTKGVAVEAIPFEEIADPASASRRAIERLTARWITSRPMPPMQFLVALDPFTFAHERLYFAARRGDVMVGLLVAVPVYRRNGWFLEDLIRDPSAPNGTAELLVDAAMSTLAERGCEYATLGLAPLSSDAPWLRFSRRLLSGFYNFDGVRAFKKKLAPDGWDPIYLAYPSGGSAVMALYDVLDAFARGKMFRFAGRAFLRASPFILRLLGSMLIAWTLLLLLAPAGRWFPSRMVQLCWATFDLLMAAALFGLAKRWRTGLAVGVATAAVADFALSSVQAITYNLTREKSIAGLTVIAVALIAPLFASLVLWGGISRHKASSVR